MSVLPDHASRQVEVSTLSRSLIGCDANQQNGQWLRLCWKTQHCVAVVAMFWTGAYEVIRRSAGPLTYTDAKGVEQFLLDDDGGQVMNGIPWWTTIPHYLLVSLAGVLICIPSYDLNYSEVPQSMRSTSIALAFFVNSMGSSLLSIIVLLFGNYVPANLNYGHLEYLFFTLGALMIVNIFFYVAVMNRMKFGMNSTRGRCRSPAPHVVSSRNEDTAGGAGDAPR